MSALRAAQEMFKNNKPVVFRLSDSSNQWIPVDPEDPMFGFREGEFDIKNRIFTLGYEAVIASSFSIKQIRECIKNNTPFLTTPNILRKANAASRGKDRLPTSFMHNLIASHRIAIFEPSKPTDITASTIQTTSHVAAPV